MKNEKLDRRVRYTKMVLRQSILELLKEKPLNKLTVTDICARADVNRNTFYTHYSSPLELLKSIENELLADLTDAVNSCEDCSDHSVMLNRICFVIYENSDICTVLFSENGDKEFLNHVMDVCHDDLFSYWRRKSPETCDRSLSRVYMFIKFGCLSIIRDWIISGMREGPGEIADFISGIVSCISDDVLKR